MMVELSCPWCEATLLVEDDLAAEHTCSECLTTWSYEEVAVVAVDVPLAA